MKKIISILLLASLLIAVLSSCHGRRAQTAFEMPEEFDTSRNYTISFWSKNDNNKKQTEIYAKAIEDFERIYPNIKVEIRPYTDYSKIYNDVITNISTGTTPNVCITYPDHIATYIMGSNTVVPLDDFLVNPEYGLGGSKVEFDAPKRTEIITKFLDELKLNGHYYGMPFMRSTEACYINKTLVEKLGYTIPQKLTWDFIWEVSEAAMKKNSDGTFAVNGQKVMIPFIYKSTDNMMIQMLKQKGAGYSTEKGEVLLFNDTTKDLLNTIAVHAKNRAFSTFKISSYPGNFLNAGQCIFAIDSTAGATWMGADAPNMDIHSTNVVDFEIEIRTIPQFDVDEPKMISQGPSLCIFNKKDPQEVLASWLFVQYLVSNEVQVEYSKTEGYLPVTVKAQNSPEYRDYLSRAGENNKEYYSVKIQASKLLMDNISNTFITPVFNGSTSLREAAGTLIDNTCKTVRKDEDVSDEYFEELFKSVTTLYKLDQIAVSD